MRLKSLLTPILLFAALALSGCQTESSDYIKLSEGGFSFLGANNEPKTIEVTSNLSWTAKSLDETWLKVTSTSTSITLTVTDNETGVERSSEIVVTAGGLVKELIVNQMPKDSDFYRFRTLHNEFQLGNVISPSGKYIGGLKVGLDEEGNYVFYPTIIDIATDVRIEMGPYPKDLLSLYGPMAMTDQGELILHDESLSNFVFNVNTDTYKLVEDFDGSRPSVSSTSADGKTWIGYVHSVSKNLSMPMKWVNGVPELLPLPDKAVRGKDFHYGAQARGISADGSIIYGTEWENNDYAMIYWDKQGNVHPVGKREITGVIQRPDWDNDGELGDYNLIGCMVSWSGKTNISETGKYIAGTYHREFLASDGKTVVGEYCAAFYNTETDETILFEDLGDSSGLAVTDEGIGFVGIPSGPVASGTVVDVKNGTILGTSQEWALQRYGIHLPDGYITYICAGGEVFMGMSIFVGALMPDNSYWYVAPPIKDAE